MVSCGQISEENPPNRQLSSLAKGRSTWRPLEIIINIFVHELGFFFVSLWLLFVCFLFFIILSVVNRSFSINKYCLFKK